jgi:hypothetical protein
MNTFDLGQLLERQHDERRQWLEEDRATAYAANEAHRKGTEGVIRILFWRGVIEFLILVTLISSL